MGVKVFGPQSVNPTASVENTDLVVNPDGSINVKTNVVTQGSAAEGPTGAAVPVNAMQVGGKDPTGNLIALKVAADGTLATTTTATTVINSEGTTNVAAPTVALHVGGKDGTGKLQALYVDPDGTLHVTGTVTATGTTIVTGVVGLASEGTPGAAAPTKAVEIGGKDATGNLQAIKTDATGQVFVTGSVSAGVTGTVTSNQGTANIKENAWPMKLTDGTDTANINSDGSLNVNITGGTLSSVINANANQGAPNTNSNGWPVKLTDGTNVLGTVTSPVHVVSDSATSVSGTVTANQGAAQPINGAWPTKLTDGTNTASVTGAGALNVAVVGGTIAADNNQGNPNTFVNGWPVKLTDGTNLLGDAAHPIIVQAQGTATVAGTVAVSSKPLDTATVLTGSRTFLAANVDSIVEVALTPTLTADARNAFITIVNDTDLNITSFMLGLSDTIGSQTVAVSYAGPAVAVLAHNSYLWNLPLIDGIMPNVTLQAVFAGAPKSGSVTVKAVVQGAGSPVVTLGGSANTVAQGTPTTLANGWPTKITDGQDMLLVNANGSINVVSTGTTTVSGAITANQGSAQASLGESWPVKLSDGVDTVAVNSDGSLNVSVVSGTITAVQSANQGTANTHANAWPVKLSDGINLLGDGAHPIIVQAAGTTAVGGTVAVSSQPLETATILTGNTGTFAGGNSITNATIGLTPNLTADVRNAVIVIANGTNANITSFSLTLSDSVGGQTASVVYAGPAVTVAANGNYVWNLALVNAILPSVKLSITFATAPTSGSAVIKAIVQGAGSPVVTLSGASTVTQGTPASLGNGWPVKLTDGVDTVNVNSDGSVNVAVVSGDMRGYSYPTLPPKTTQLTVGTSPIALRAGASDMPNRTQLIVKGSGDFFIGDSAVSTTTGYRVTAGETWTIEFHPSTGVTFYAVSSPAVAVYIMEVA